MKKLFIRHYFTKLKKADFGLFFPDYPECMTQGEDIQNAYEMAWDALGLAIVSRLESKEALPVPTEPYAIPLDSDTFCVIVAFDLIAYQKGITPRQSKNSLHTGMA